MVKTSLVRGNNTFRVELQYRSGQKPTCQKRKVCAQAGIQIATGQMTLYPLSSPKEIPVDGHNISCKCLVPKAPVAYDQG